MTSRDGRVNRLENVFIRGGHIKFIVLPDLLKASPILKKISAMKVRPPSSPLCPCSCCHTFASILPISRLLVANLMCPQSKSDKDKAAGGTAAGAKKTGGMGPGAKKPRNA